MDDEAEITWRSRYSTAIEGGSLIAKYSADGSRILRWYIDFTHRLLNVHKELSAPELLFTTA